VSDSSIESLLERILSLPRGSAVMFLGATDTGKSTLLRMLVNAVRDRGLSVGLLDLDLGQGELGPPATISASYSLDRAPVRNVRDLPVFETYFVGSVTPARHLLELCIGGAHLLASVRRKDPDIILIDTCGYVSGPAARTLKRRQIESLNPKLIVALQRNGEMEPILAALAGLSSPEVMRLSPDPQVGRKSPATRATRRAARFLNALADGVPTTFDFGGRGARNPGIAVDESLATEFDSVGLAGAGFIGGRPHPLTTSTMIGKAIRASVMYSADMEDGSAFVVVRQDRWETDAIADLAATLKRKPLTIVPASNYAHLLVGLVDRDRVLRGVGTIERIDFERRTLTVLTKCHPGAVAQIWLGHLRVRRDGREIGEVRASEI